MFCQVRLKLCQRISNFISTSVALGRRFNAASEKENKPERIYIHMFYIQMSIKILMNIDVYSRAVFILEKRL